MNSRQSGIDWLHKKGRRTDERVAVSKYYAADESWSKRPAWWFEFAAAYATKDPFGFLNLLCGVAPDSSEFHHLRVPMGLFLASKHHLGFLRAGDKFSLWLSAEEPTLFREVRGDGRIEFAMFRVD